MLFRSLSDSGALVVRGIRRLEQFVTSDLTPTTLSDDIWATVSHMLQRCLVVRGLPKKHVAAEGASVEQKEEMEMEYTEYVKEFIAEDSFLLNRRFVGTIATTTIGSLLCNERFSIGLRWRLFLIKWLYRGIREWDSAAALLVSTTDTKQGPNLTTHPDMYVSPIFVVLLDFIRRLSHVELSFSCFTVRTIVKQPCMDVNGLID